MTIASKQNRTFLALSASLLSLGACASHAPTAAPAEYLEGTVLSRNELNVTQRTEFLEIAIDPTASELSNADRVRIGNFIGVYTQKGHGPLVLSLPAASANPQLAVTATAEARAIAWEKGVRYDEISGEAYGAGSAVSQPLILAFQVYDAVPPECASKASVDFSDIDSNNNLPTLGCSVRTNLAAMIADPADLLGARALDAGDATRREVILEKFRAGKSTAAERTAQESGAISQAVN
ncbi:CpaD family pilus assembly protein [Hyphomonas sp.]|uniref:CpaD family pilus assembly protein n=1 Tax=Hyphomonas sp. TaxID=87 RepID=UPI0039195EF7